MECVNYHRLTELLLDLGESMLSCGAEIHRIEDTVNRMSLAYGAVKANVFAFTSSIVLTLNFEDGTQITESRRVSFGGDTNFNKLDELNSLSRRCVKNPIPITELEESITNINRKNVPAFRLYLGSALVGGGFAVFFGGTIWDGLVAILSGLFICFLQIRLSPICPNKVFFNFAASLLSGLVIGLAAKLFPFLNADKIMIGDIMLLVPGIAITNAVRDMLLGDTVSGVMKLMQCLIWAGALACGFMLAISLLGG